MHAACTTGSVCCCGVAGLHSTPVPYNPPWCLAAEMASRNCASSASTAASSASSTAASPSPAADCSVEVARVQAQRSAAGVWLSGRGKQHCAGPSCQQRCLCLAHPNIPGRRQPIQQLALALIPTPGPPAGRRARAGTSPARTPQTSAAAEVWVSRRAAAGRVQLPSTPADEPSSKNHAAHALSINTDTLPQPLPSPPHLQLCVHLAPHTQLQRRRALHPGGGVATSPELCGDTATT